MCCVVCTFPIVRRFWACPSIPVRVSSLVRVAGELCNDRDEIERKKTTGRVPSGVINRLKEILALGSISQLPFTFEDSHASGQPASLSPKNGFLWTSWREIGLSFPHCTAKVRRTAPGRTGIPGIVQCSIHPASQFSLHRTSTANSDLYTTYYICPSAILPTPNAGDPSTAAHCAVHCPALQVSIQSGCPTPSFPFHQLRESTFASISTRVLLPLPETPHGIGKPHHRQVSRRRKGSTAPNTVPFPNLRFVGRFHSLLSTNLGFLPLRQLVRVSRISSLARLLLSLRITTNNPLTPESPLTTTQISTTNPISDVALNCQTRFEYRYVTISTSA